MSRIVFTLERAHLIMSDEPIPMKRKPLSYILSSLLLTVLLASEAQALDLLRKYYVSETPDRLKFESNYEGGQFGSKLESGDFDGDGYDDLLVSSPFATGNGREWNGVVEIIWGNADGLDERSSFYGESEWDQLGSSLATGDFNGDGTDDIAIGAYNAETPNKRTGMVYVVHAEQSEDSQMITRLDSHDLRVDEADQTIDSSKVDGGLFGLSIAAADFNQDEYTDLLVGAPATLNKNRESVGAVYSYFGSANGVANIASKIVYGINEGEMFGSSIAAGRLNGDESVDLLVGSHLADKNDFKEAGRVYYYQNYLTELKGKKYDKLFSGVVKNEWFGFDVNVADLNNDGFDDALMSSFPYRGAKNLSKLSSYFGGWEFYDLYSDVTVQGSQGNSLLGASIEIEDLNGDGYVDMILGAPAVGKMDTIQSGKVYIIYGGAEGFDSNYVVHHEEVDSIVYGEDLDDWFGYSVEVLDFNGDGMKDLAVGARYSNSEKAVNSGAVYVLLGDGNKFGDLTAGVVFEEEEVVNRGEFVAKIIESFELKETKASYIDSCYAYIECCLFNFMAASYYDDIQLEPELILYPDVGPDHQHYEEINLATLMGIVNGYSGEENSPFHPEFSVSRIQALKIILGATDLVKPKFRFELAEDLGGEEYLLTQESVFDDILASVDYMWWYPRYVNFAVEADIIDAEGSFRPDSLITATELDEMIARTIEYLNQQNGETES